MSDISSLLSGLEGKIRQLIASKKEIEKAQNSLLTDHQRLVKIVEQQKEELKKLKDQNDILSLAKSVDLGEDKDQMKKKINQLVRDVNKCISFLNQ